VKRKKAEEYKLLNGMLFLSFIAPAIFAIIIGLQMNLFYMLVIIWVHEAGHGFWCLLGNRMFCSFGGTLNELLFTAVPALICFKKKEIYLAGIILLMCAGMSIENSGVYMQSAEHPSGTGFLNMPLTRESHDWSVISRGLGVVESSYEIGRFTEQIGHAMSVIFFAASIWGLALIIFGRYPAKLSTLVGGGAIPSATYFIITGAGTTEIVLSLLLSAKLLKKALWSFVARYL